tara:strand:+ start:1916 stop:3310 length:1395 start_codon:yes stop_codon:yes gene_type:complete
MNRLAVINVVGLCDRHIGPSMPFTQAMKNLGQRAFIRPAFPAVTCTAQSNYLTGKNASIHGIVANGWYNRDLAEVQFWKQPNQLVQAPKIWDTLRVSKPNFTCAKIFWWFNMYSSVDWSISPRPMYPADGRKIPDIYTYPASVRTKIAEDLGEFPFHGFWGPAAGRSTSKGTPDCASRWIAESAIWIEKKHSPTLSLVYLPHLDYNLQRVGPNDPSVSSDLRLIDNIIRDLVTTYKNRGVEPILISEYGITECNKAVHLNRIFREQGWLTVREELGLELLDAGASRVFAVADHQIAHIYLNDFKIKNEVQALLQSTEGVDTVMDIDSKTENGINHARAGDLIAVSEENAWFTYYYWMEDDLAPDFARTVDIHRKPGYDPLELFIDPKIKFPKSRIAARLLQKKFGLRMLMDVVPLDPTLVNGSHGCTPKDRADWPVLITGNNTPLNSNEIVNTDIHDVIINSME